MNDNEQEFINNLVEQIEHKYRGLEFHVIYGRDNRPIGEIDVLAQRIDGHYDAYEVKTTKSGIGKAKKQLRRAKRRFPYGYIRDTYIYLGIEDRLIEHMK